MDSCKKVDTEGLLIKLIDKKLDSKEEEEVLTHLRACPVCLAKMARVLLSDNEMQEIFLADPAKGLPAGANTETEDASNDAPPPGSIETSDKPNQDNSKYKEGPIRVDDLPVGAKIEHNIYDGSGKLLIANNTPLTKGIIDGIKRRGLSTVTLKAPETSVDTARIREATAFKGKPDREFYLALPKGGVPVNVSLVAKQVAIDSLKRAFAKTGTNSTIDIDDVRDTCEDIVGELVEDDIVSPSIIDMYLLDPSLYHHSINVMIIFTCICSAMDLPVGTVKSYAVGAMLHDIGKVFLHQVAVREGKKEFDIDKVHSEAGYKYLQSMGGIEMGVLNAIRNHHERIDRKGFPRGVGMEELGYYTQALILANYYDNLTWDRSRELKANFYNAANSIIQQGRKLVSSHIINAFLNVFGHYPPGSWVKLSSREAGLVVQGTPFKPRAPVVHLYYGSSGERLDEVIPLNLSEPEMPHITEHFIPS